MLSQRLQQCQQRPVFINKSRQQAPRRQIQQRAVPKQPQVALRHSSSASSIAEPATVGSKIKGFFRNIFEPFVQSFGWLSSNPVRRAEARNAAEHATTTTVSIFRGGFEKSKSFLPMLAQGVSAILGGVALGLTGIYGVFTAKTAIDCHRKMRQLENATMKTPKLKAIRDFAQEQHKSRRNLKITATIAATLQLVGGAVCVAAANAWNPIGWAFMGTGLVITIGWLIWTAIDWLASKIRPTDPTENEIIQSHAKKLVHFLKDKEAPQYNEAVTLLKILGVVQKHLSPDQIIESPKTARRLIEYELRGAKDFFI